MEKIFLKYLSVLIGLLCCSFFFCTAKKTTEVPEPQPSTTTIEELKIGNSEISGWTSTTENADTFCTYPIDSFYCCAPGSIDGGAVPYDSVGCNEVGFQTLTGPSSMLYKSHVMNFETVAKALGMYEYLKSRNSARTALDGFDPAIAFSTVAYQSISAYAHFNKYYMEIEFAGVTDTAAALSAAKDFLMVLKSRIK